MAYNVTTTWVSGDPVTASQLNTEFANIETETDGLDSTIASHVAADLLRADIVTQFASGFTETTKSSNGTTYTDSNATTTIVISSTSTIMAWYTGAGGISGAGNTASAKLVIDGSDAGETTWGSESGTAVESVAIAGRKINVGAGTITVKVQYKRDQASGAAIMNAGNIGQLLVMAVKE